MSRFDVVKEREKSSISVVELKRLLVDLREKKPGICVRFRLLGELWAKNFMTIAALTDKGVVLKDEADHRLVAISNLSDIVQFEMDEPYHAYRPYFHYDVIPSPEFTL